MDAMIDIGQATSMSETLTRLHQLLGPCKRMTLGLTSILPIRGRGSEGVEVTVDMIEATALQSLRASCSMTLMKLGIVEYRRVISF